MALSTLSLTPGRRSFIAALPDSMPDDNPLCCCENWITFCMAINGGMPLTSCLATRTFSSDVLTSSAVGTPAISRAITPRMTNLRIKLN